jgi:carbon storage regulator
MLVLSRKQNERIVIGESVVVTVVRIAGDKVRIGVEAPAELRVVRDEIVDRLDETGSPRLFSRAG